MQKLDVSSVRMMIGDYNRCISDINNQLDEIEEKINALDSNEANSQDLNALFIKRDVLKSDKISCEENIDICNRILHDFAVSSVLSDDSLVEWLSSDIVEMKISENEQLKKELEYYSDELSLREKINSLVSFKPKHFMYESLVATPISKEQYIKYFFKELNDYNLLNDVYDLVLKYDSKFSSNIEYLKNNELDNLDFMFEGHFFKDNWKECLNNIKLYADLLTDYNFCNDLQLNNPKYDSIPYFKDKFVFPKFKTCTKEDIIKASDNINNDELKDYISQFDLDNLTSFEAYCIVYKMEQNKMFILKNADFIYENEQEIFRLSKLKSILSRVIKQNEFYIENLSTDDKSKILSSYFGGINLGNDILPINSSINYLIGEANSYVDKYLSLEVEKNKIVDMINCYKKGPIYDLFNEFGMDRQNFISNGKVYSTDVLKNIYMDISDFNRNIKNSKTEVSDLLTVVEKLTSNIDRSKKDYDDYVALEDKKYFTTSRGKFVKNKFFRFFFKFSKQYKQNVLNFNEEKANLESIYENYKNDYKVNFDKMNEAKKNLEILQKDKDEYVALSEKNHEGIVDKAFRYNTYLENSGYEKYSNYLNLVLLSEEKTEEINKIFECYISRLREILCFDNLSSDFINDVNGILDSNKPAKLNYVDKKNTDYYDHIFSRYSSSDVIYNSLISNNFDYTMDEDEAIYNLVGKVKKKSI